MRRWREALRFSEIYVTVPLGDGIEGPLLTFGEDFEPLVTFVREAHRDKIIDILRPTAPHADGHDMGRRDDRFPRLLINGITFAAQIATMTSDPMA